MAAFSREEYLQRLQQTKKKMAEKGMDVLMVVDHSNIFYLTGYDGHSAYVPQGLFVLAHEEEPRLVLRDMDVPGGTAFIKASNIFGYPEDYIAHNRAHPFDYFGDLLRQWGIDGKRFGVETDFLSPNSWQRLQAAVPNARFIEANNLVTWQRLKKSAAELVYMGQAGQIADLAMQAAYDTIGVGVREAEVAAAVMAAQVRGTPDFAGDRPVTPAMPTGNPRVAAPHLSWTDARHEYNSVTNIELGGFRHRYTAGLSRTLVLGKPEDRLVSLYEATRDAVDTVFAQVKAGWTCEEVEALYRQTTRKHGFEKKSRVGYAIGIDWTEKTASLRNGDTTELEPDMTFHLMAGMWYDSWGFVQSEVFRVTDSGIESFSTLSRDLFVK
jgi:Xaa-Pro dipeptidase